MATVVKKFRKRLRAAAGWVVAATVFAPDERAWIRPAMLTHVCAGRRSQDTGRIRGGDWDRPDQEITTLWRYQCCLRHWANGESWEDTGAYDELEAQIALSPWGEIDGCRTPEDVRARYARLDELFARAKIGGIPSRSKRIRGRTIEIDPVRINIGRHGKPFSGFGGMHRLAMSQALGLDWIPVGLGLVHIRAIPELARRRRPAARSLDWYIG